MTRSTWSIVLAGGEGSRLSMLTQRAAGDAVPKQYCSLRGGRTLLGDAIERARTVTEASRVVTIVAAEHRAHWSREFSSSSPHRLVVQPRNRGTAAGILLPLLEIAAHDPEALVVILPSDHHVRREAVLELALRDALRAADAAQHAVVLLGIAPECADAEYGWIVAGDGPSMLRRVARFVEKPAPDVAWRLYESGGLWNSFIMVASVSAFLELFSRRLPQLLDRFRGAALERGRATERLQALYDSLETRDFSREVLQGGEEHLLVQRVAACGWTDLGTPRRLAECLAEEAAVVRACERVDEAVLALDHALQAYQARRRALHAVAES